MKMKLQIVLLVLFVLISGCVENSKSNQDPKSRLAEVAADLEAAESNLDRFMLLGDAAKLSLEVGSQEEAQRYAEELLVVLRGFENNWNYGNALQDANVVLGRIALSEGRIDDAKNHLLASARSEGSPQMNSFGPDMNLALELLKVKEFDVVLEYFELCRSFWENDRGRLDDWSRQVKDREIPDFGARL